MKTDALAEISAETRDEMCPPCEGASCGHAPAVGIVTARCATCGRVHHLLCGAHIDRIVMYDPLQLFIHPPCGSRDTEVIRIDPL